MASGVPVLASDIPVHREIAGPAAVFFDPYQPLDLAGALARVLGNSSLRRRLVAAGLRRSRRYSWLRSARETWLAYRWAAGAT
jgi:glycosyltransferase involved in cell wall biosynthesis